MNLNNGNVNNNNTYNRYFTVGASELSYDADDWLAAEARCFRNKHKSIGAARLHYHPRLVLPIGARVADGTFTPGRSYCFILTRPVLREIYAAFPPDRIVHHYVAPFIAAVAEAVHTANGDVSHGNRKGHSARTAAGAVAEHIRNWEYVVKIDFQGFFMSIPRQQAFDYLKTCADKYYHGTDKEEKLAICRKLICGNPLDDCLYVGDPALLDRIDRRKTLRHAREGCGLPIGNFYSQLVANLYLAQIDEVILAAECPMSRFVDDVVFFAHSPEQAHRVIEAVERKAAELGLTLHPRKRYIQPAHRGVTMCGYTVKGRRIYLNNRALHSCRQSVKATPATEEGARKMCSTANSYLGFLRHCTERKNEERIAAAVLGRFGRWIYFRHDGGHLVCCLKRRYRDQAKSLNQIKQFHHAISKETKERQPHAGYRRKWAGGRRTAA